VRLNSAAGKACPMEEGSNNGVNGHNGIPVFNIIVATTMRRDMRLVVQ